MGWQCGQWWVATALAALFAAPLFVTFNLRFSPTDLKRFATVSLLVAASQIIYLFIKPGASSAVFKSILWTPFIFAPFALSLIYSRTTQVDFRKAGELHHLIKPLFEEETGLMIPTLASPVLLNGERACAKQPPPRWKV